MYSLDLMNLSLTLKNLPDDMQREPNFLKGAADVEEGGKLWKRIDTACQFNTQRSAIRVSTHLPNCPSPLTNYPSPLRTIRRRHELSVAALK